VAQNQSGKPHSNSLESTRPELRVVTSGLFSVMLQLLVAGAAGNVLFAGGSLLMHADSRLAVFVGLLCVFGGTLVIFGITSRLVHAGTRARPALGSCACILMLVPPLSSRACQTLYWHLGDVGMKTAILSAVPVLVLGSVAFCTLLLRRARTPVKKWGLTGVVYCGVLGLRVRGRDGD